MRTPRETHGSGFLLRNLVAMLPREVVARIWVDGAGGDGSSRDRECVGISRPRCFLKDPNVAAGLLLATFATCQAQNGAAVQIGKPVGTGSPPLRLATM